MYKMAHKVRFLRPNPYARCSKLELREHTHTELEYAHAFIMPPAIRSKSQSPQTLRRDSSFPSFRYTVSYSKPAFASFISILPSTSTYLHPPPVPDSYQVWSPSPPQDDTYQKIHFNINMGNSTLLIDPSQGPTKELLQYLRDLPAQHKAMIMDAMEDPIQKARMVVKAQGGYMPWFPNPTREQIILAYQECYNDIVKGEVDKDYIDSIRESILSHPVPESHRHEQKDGVEQLLSLASRLVKGEHCGECNTNFKSPTRRFKGLDELHGKVGRSIVCIIGDAKGSKAEWSLSLKSKFALNKLSYIYPHEYRPLKFLIRDPNPRSAIYETMWCHENEHSVAGHGKDDSGEHKMICRCWDEGYEEAHCKTCYWGEQGEGYSHVKQ